MSAIIQYLIYLHKTNTTAFTIISTNRRAKFHLSSTIIGRASLFSYIINFQLMHTADSVHQLVNKLFNLVKWANLSHNGETDMEFGMRGEYNGVDFVEVSNSEQKHLAEYILRSWAKNLDRFAQ